jgi:hypothetical protein
MVGFSIPKTTYGDGVSDGGKSGVESVGAIVAGGIGVHVFVGSDVDVGTGVHDGKGVHVGKGVNVGSGVKVAGDMGDAISNVLVGDKITSGVMVAPSCGVKICIGVFVRMDGVFVARAAFLSGDINQTPIPHI